MNIIYDTLKIRIPIRLVKKKKYYIASCPGLDVVTQGKSKKEAKSNLAEALSLYFLVCGADVD